MSSRTSIDSRKANDAPIPLSQHNGNDTGTSEDNAVVSCQRNSDNNSNRTTVRYGGTEPREAYTASPKKADADEASNCVVVPSRMGVFGGRGHPRTSADGTGVCIVVNDTTGNTGTFMGKIRHFLLNNDPLLFALLKWGLAALLLLFLAFVVFGILYSGMRYNDNCTVVPNHTMGEGVPGWCYSPFGTILGAFKNTYAHSNCNDDYVSIMDSSINLTVPVMDTATGMLTLTSKEFYTGLAWQCVEYARRYWMLNGRPKPAYFGSVDRAADIWNLTEVHLLENTSQTLPLHRYKSGDRVVRDSLQLPQSGDIIIYPVQPDGFPVGHVAVIAKVETGEHGFIYVAEQNWGSRQWPGPFYNYSRKIPLHYNPATTTVTLDDPAGKIIGWMRYG